MTAFAIFSATVINLIVRDKGPYNNSMSNINIQTNRGVYARIIAQTVVINVMLKRNKPLSRIAASGIGRK
jgi:hypothetical protein